MRLCTVQNTPKLGTKHLTVITNEAMDIFLHEALNCASIQFVRKPYSFLEKNVMGSALQAPERILIVDAPRPIHSTVRRRKELPKRLKALATKALKKPTRTQKNGDEMCTLAAKSSAYEKTS